MPKSGPDIIDKILDACYHSNKDALFIMSLMHQYEDRGFLTRKQLQGLYYKAEKLPDLAPGLLATLQATIDRLPVRDKQPATIVIKETEKDEAALTMIRQILELYPQHKAVLALQTKIDTHHTLTPAETTDLKKLHKLIMEKSNKKAPW
jgi:hypothetical protein